MENYSIKDGYKINEINITNDKVNDVGYWNKKRNTAANAYQFPVYEFLSKYITKNNIDRVIDVGCGVGRKLVHVHKENPGVEIIGIDQESPIEYCKKTYGFGSWYSDDFESSHLSNNIKSKLIISSDVIEHLINPNLLLNYIKSKIEKDGVIILSTPERDLLRGPGCNYSPNKHHVREWSYKEFELYLESQGFEILDHFLQYPIRMRFGKIFFNEIVKRLIKLKPLKYNQVVVVRLK